MNNNDELNKLVIFKDKNIRRILYNNEWWFSVIDVVGALTDSANPRDYWSEIKTRVSSEDRVELSTICLQLKLKAPDGKMRLTDCVNTESLLRIIQSRKNNKKCYKLAFFNWIASSITS
ncbi:hypothetical protein A3306_07015 [Rickettsia bellii]|uniref:Bro-N domain-containing protein n=3 Tax=Rickettsia bellii TaxID=33990 RepID=Q1RJ27_RICBR|nr:Bro-N domain-containing protein [Rickettsia bellii]ABE04637.1 unknown [Rickettsia bellii RML369-C]ABV78996.1 hypothetical protein A1I_03175 [Rickettsia bellii OSU 85-389]ARD86855.1 hypothetical protein A3306_07015 [Rickettsia bellii]KJV89416.1 BRO family, N-terminal domain protein [Rickettsia bellii str. RML An4]KJV91681.1 BRO family, N-terminal domain protein [Rickettsia bellii str. RML Mogi]